MRETILATTRVNTVVVVADVNKDKSYLQYVKLFQAMITAAESKSLRHEVVKETTINASSRLHGLTIAAVSAVFSCCLFASS